MITDAIPAVEKVLGKSWVCGRTVAAQPVSTTGYINGHGLSDAMEHVLQNRNRIQP